MSFLAPYFLIGLSALLVPILIHLWSKDAKKTVSFGSLRFLRESETRTTRSIMPSQWLLLMLRLVLLTLMVFLMADMQIPSQEDKAPRMYLLDAFYQGSAVVTQLLDTIEEGVEVRWLAKDYPSIDQPVNLQTSDYWDLLGDIPITRAECIIVISPLHQQAFIGKRKNLPAICEWIKPPGEVKTSQLAELSKDGVNYLLTASYDEWSTTYEQTESASGTPIEVTYFMEVSTAYEDLGAIFHAALSSIQNVSTITLKQSETMNKADWIIWLSGEARPVEMNVIAVDQDIFGLKYSGKRLIHVSSDLSSEEAIQLELPRKLLNAFVDDRFEDVENELLTVDPNTFSYKSREATSLAAADNAAPYLWIALLVILVLERRLSYKSMKISV